jgi:hypothetical protein
VLAPRAKPSRSACLGPVPTATATEEQPLKAKHMQSDQDEPAASRFSLDKQHGWWVARLLEVGAAWYFFTHRTQRTRK